MMKAPLPSYVDLRARVEDALGAPTWRPILIGIDGANGTGKSSAASWLAWQFGMPVIHLDFYVVRGSRPLKWLNEEVARLIGGRLDEAKRSIIVEGVLLLDALAAAKRKADFLIFVEGEPEGRSLEPLIKGYFERRRPRSRADFCLPAIDEENPPA